MELSWWPVAIAGLIGLAVAVALALLLPTEQLRRQLQPLANTARLTRLPQYARLARRRALSMIATIVLLVVLFAASLLAAARPVGSSWLGGAAEAPADIMLCVGAPVTDPATGEFLGYFAEQSTTYGAERIGLTSINRRVIPMTGDHQYAAGRLGDLARLAQLSGEGELSPPERLAARDGIRAFAPPVAYVDYAPGVEDLLALCVTGFPSFDEPSSHRRALIYLGPDTIRRPGEDRPTLFTDQRVEQVARDAGVQINAVTTGSGPGSALRSIVRSTGGQYFGDQRDDIDAAAMTAHLDAIAAAPPPAARPGGAQISGATPEFPTIPLTVAVVVSVLLSLSLVVLRR